MLSIRVGVNFRNIPFGRAMFLTGRVKPYCYRAFPRDCVTMLRRSHYYLGSLERGAVIRKDD